MYKLIIFDMDGVIFQHRNFWVELHKAFGTLEQGKQLIKKYRNSKNWIKLVKKTLDLWKEKDISLYYNLINSFKFTPGTKETFKAIKNKGLITAIISSASMDLARRAQKELGIDHIFANTIFIKNNKITGEFSYPIGIGKEKKAEIIKHLCKDLEISLSEVIYIGDEDDDIEAFKIVGKAIAFNSKKEKVKKAADYVVDNNLKEILKYIL